MFTREEVHGGKHKGRPITNLGSWLLAAVWRLALTIAEPRANGSKLVLSPESFQRLPKSLHASAAWRNPATGSFSSLRPGELHQQRASSHEGLSQRGLGVSAPLPHVQSMGWTSSPLPLLWPFSYLRQGPSRAFACPAKAVLCPFPAALNHSKSKRETAESFHCYTPCLAQVTQQVTAGQQGSVPRSFDGMSTPL